MLGSTFTYEGGNGEAETESKERTRKSRDPGRQQEQFEEGRQTVDSCALLVHEVGRKIVRVGN